MPLLTMFPDSDEQGTRGRIVAEETQCRSPI